jgi:hypothetical protein
MMIDGYVTCFGCNILVTAKTNPSGSYTTLLHRGDTGNLRRNLCQYNAFLEGNPRLLAKLLMGSKVVIKEKLITNDKTTTYTRQP